MSDPIRSVSDAGDVEQAVAEVVAEITDRLQAGQSVDVEAYIARCPEAAERIRRLVPALQVMEALKSAPADGEIQDEGLTGTLGDYRIVREVGRGGMGVVYEAEQISLGRRVALKVLPFAATADPRQLKRFHNEARAAASLEHPGVVPVYGVGCERGVHYYAMRFIDGRTLAEIIDSLRGEGQPNPTTPYSPGEPAPPSTDTAVARTTERVPRDAAYFRLVAEWCAQAAEALEQAHQLGVIHRDVKPHNLMLDDQGKLWVTDFGLARLAADNGLTMSGDLLGTLRYMSPEQALARTGMVDHRADVYGLGATLYELLTLQPAVGGAGRKEVLYQIAFGDPAPPCKLTRTVPRDLETVAMKALEKSPRDRYTTAGEMAADLRRILEDRPIAARPPSWRQRAARWRRKHPATTAAVLAALVVASVTLVGSVGWTAGERRARWAETERVVETALADAAEWLHKDRPYEALSAVLRAEGFVRQAGGHPALESRVDEMLWDVRLLLRLEQARLSRSSVRDGSFDTTASDEDYEQAFKEFGLDLLRMDVAEAAARIGEREIRVELAAFLDDWASVRFAARKGKESGWRMLLEVAKRVDTNERRTRVRDAIARSDWKELDRLAKIDGLDGLVGISITALAAWTEDHRSSPLAAWTEGRSASSPVVAQLRRAQQKRPDDFWVNHALGFVLQSMKPPQWEEAISYYRAAVAVRPQSPGAFLNLGVVLRNKGKVGEAIACFREAIRLRPDYDDAHVDLGAALADNGKVDEAIACFREAIRLKPDNAMAHNNMGVVLKKKGKVDEAIAYYREAIRLNPEYAETHSSLGNALADNGKVGEAIACFREAIRVKPDYAEFHDILGVLLGEQGKVGEAIACFREAIRLKPDYAMAHFNLGVWLSKKGKAAEAIACYREAIRLKPDSSEAHINLGVVLGEKGKVDEAIACFREAIRLNPDSAEVHGNLGHGLKMQGQLSEALAALRRGHELGSLRPDWPYPSAQWVREVERLVELDGKLASVLKGDARPATAAEAAELASLCVQYKRRPVAAARLFADAFDGDPKLAQRLDSHRYNAACSAALAAAGQGIDADGLSAMDRLALRRQALTWLAADFNAWRNLFEKDAIKAGPIVVNQMKHSLADADFASVRGPEALAKLPFAERQAWRQLWADVAELLARAEATPPPAKK